MPQARARDIKFARILPGITTIIIVNHNGAALALLVEIALTKHGRDWKIFYNQNRN